MDKETSYEYLVGCVMIATDCQITKARKLVNTAILSKSTEELTAFYKWVQSEGRLHSEIKHHYETRIAELTSKKHLGGRND